MLFEKDLGLLNLVLALTGVASTEINLLSIKPKSLRILT
ncbi:hypothetical protein CAAU_1083 [Caloramator australicus RC3]|uniref:Uncharacterized protein n=1 Tax=Caloramator australicus RC3 TaxID=857293 RepID=I7LIR7_9CLOT|nr:hypothetical protein CAAU_0912 [Caloramator australicus RC3]CCJ33167.1 hypothetical protein CAAU_1083 [Caloramator australicus RC3]